MEPKIGPYVQDNAALITFEVKLTWIGAKGPTLTTATAATALTGLVALGTIGWRRGFLENQAY